MDLANAIAEEAVQLHKRECETNICTLNLSISSRYKYAIQVTPMLKHVLIRYKSLEYKICREDRQTYEEIVTYLIEAILEDHRINESYDVEYGVIWPEEEEDYGKCTLNIRRFDQTTFYEEFLQNSITKILRFHLMPLRVLN